MSGDGISVQCSYCSSVINEIQRSQVAAEKIMPGVASFAISKALDQAVKRCKKICQRSNMLSRAIRNSIRASTTKSQLANERHRVGSSTKRLLTQREGFSEATQHLAAICHHIKTDRANHILAIEKARGKRIFDKHCEFQTSAIELTG